MPNHHRTRHRLVSALSLATSNLWRPRSPSTPRASESTSSFRGTVKEHHPQLPRHHRVVVQHPRRRAQRRTKVAPVMLLDITRRQRVPRHQSQRQRKRARPKLETQESTRPRKSPSTTPRMTAGSSLMARYLMLPRYVSIRGWQCQMLTLLQFLPDHPGGEKAILLYAGRDATEEFNMLHDPKVIPRYAPEATIGVLKN